ncbi:nucleoside phosphorylase domain-containing protein [Trichoderma camerunense]
MPSNTSISIHGSGPQNISSGDGPQYNNNASGIQVNSGNFIGFNPFREFTEFERLPMENRGDMPGDDQSLCREDFHVAIICTLPLEYDAISLVFDQFWDEDGDSYGRAHGDTNRYTTGQIWKHNVVLALLPNIGTASAAGAAANFRSSYSAVKLTLLVGICGGVPGTGPDEILLGDVVISKTVIQHTLGRQYPNKFMTKDTVYDSLGRPNKDIRSLIASFETERGRRQLRQKAGQYLRDLQCAAIKERHRCSYRYPGVDEDKLFAASYHHKHRASQKCKCNQESDGLCEEAAQALCSTLMCDEGQLVRRERLLMKKDLELDDAQCPEIFVGCVASGDTVMKSGEHRDRIARQRDIIAFEMEGAGIWDELPCSIIKGVCDYADSHKNKVWQPFAAATAASVMKAMLGRYALTEPSPSYSRVIPGSHVR